MYMPPEMAACDPVKLGPRSDVYLLGAILFEIVTGIPPHDGDGPLAALVNAAGNVLSRSGQSDGLLSIAYRAMATEPAQRYGDVPAFQRAVTECLTAEEHATLVRKADGLFSSALKKGRYETFQQAIAGYDAALAMMPDSRETGNKRLEAVLAYSRKALANGEYDLAASVIGPETHISTDASVLLNTIDREKRAAQRRRRRNVFVAFGSLVVVAAVLLGLFIVYYRNRDKLEDISTAARTYDTAMRSVQENRVYNGLVTELRQLNSAVVVAQTGSPTARRNKELGGTLSTLGADLAALEENFRFPDANDIKRKNAACAAVQKELPRIRRDRDTIQQFAEKAEQPGEKELWSGLVGRMDRLIEYAEAFTPFAGKDEMQ